MAAASNLSASQFGYDYVVATTQKSINATMKRWLFSIDEPAFVVCYVADDNGNSVPIDYEELKKRANGVDPFAIPMNIDPATNKDFKSIYDARFLGGFRVTPGTPEEWEPQNIPDILSFKPDSTTEVIFSMYCSQFDVVQLENSGWGKPKWFNASQTAANPWIFRSTVDLSQDAVDGNAYSQMPEAIQKAIHDLSPGTFSVQQLYFDVATASLYSTPEIEGVAKDSPLGAVLSREFVDRYMDKAKKGGQPLLGVNITQPQADAASLKMTDFALQINPYVDSNGNAVQTPDKTQKAASTLSYLCMTGHHPLPQANHFPWNWVDASVMDDQHGLVSVNRNAFIAWLAPQLLGYFQSNCIQPQVRVSLDSLSQPVYSYSYQNSRPTCTAPQNGDIVYKADWQSSTASDEAGWHGAIGKFSMWSSYHATVQFKGNQIIILQQFVVWAYIEKDSSSGEGKIVDRTLKDTYTLGVDAKGQITWQVDRQSATEDYDPQVNGFLNFFLNINKFISDLESWARNLASTNLSQPPLNGIANFVFPGGKVFAFRSAQFSNNQDFTAAITYLNPNAVNTVYKAVERKPNTFQIQTKRK